MYQAIQNFSDERHDFVMKCLFLVMKIGAGMQFSHLSTESK